jgi:hypothetical protein
VFIQEKKNAKRKPSVSAGRLSEEAPVIFCSIGHKNPWEVYGA